MYSGELRLISAFCKPRHPHPTMDFRTRPGQAHLLAFTQLSGLYQQTMQKSSDTLTRFPLHPSSSTFRDTPRPTSLPAPVIPRPPLRRNFPQKDTSPQAHFSSFSGTPNTVSFSAEGNDTDDDTLPPGEGRSEPAALLAAGNLGFSTDSGVGDTSGGAAPS